MTAPIVPTTPIRPTTPLSTADIVALLEAARRAAARSVNALMTPPIGRSAGASSSSSRAAGTGRVRAGPAQAPGCDLSAALAAAFQQNLEQMRLFYLPGPRADLQTASAKLPPPDFADAVCRIWLQPSTAGNPSTCCLAQAFPLPWSAYVRLLSVKNEQARAF
jgi:hypothetical protein